MLTVFGQGLIMGSTRQNTFLFLEILFFFRLINKEATIIERHVGYIDYVTPFVKIL